jgi:2-haloacid dehalogenase
MRCAPSPSWIEVQMTQNPTIAVFDVGNVLIEWDPRHLYRRIFTDAARMEWFLTEVCTNDWNVEQDRGRSFADAVAERTARFPDLAEEIRAYDERWPEMVPGAIAESVALLEQLRANGTRTFAITNFSAEKFPLAQQRFSFLRDFEGVVVSGEERLLKPEPAIYRTLLDRHGLTATDCLFIDDSPKNVAGARAVGMHAHHFTSPAALAEELTRSGFRAG